MRYVMWMKLSDQDRALFDKLLEEIILTLPAEFRERLAEIPVVLDDEPSVELQKELGAYEPGEPSDLCGLHSGPSHSEGTGLEQVASAPLIQLFRGPIFRLAGAKPKALKREIRITLLHELGHHFDFSEEELADRGYG